MMPSILDGVTVMVALLETAHVSDAELARYRAMLSESELTAATRMSDPRLHLCARAFVREQLSRHDPSIAPRDWSLSRTEAGKPYVHSSSPGLVARGVPELSLSHTDGLVACAVATRPVGIDVEPLSRAEAILDTVLRAFAPEEIAAVRRLPVADQPRHAVTLWTVKEAYLKGLGTGISRHLDRLVVRPALGDLWEVAEAPAWRVETRVHAERSGFQARPGERWIVAIASQPA